jgi:hypothetical protein
MYRNIALLPLMDWKALSALVPCIAKAAMINSGIAILLHN